MRVIVAGSRSITDYEKVKQILDTSPYKITCLVNGLANGVDTLAYHWAKENKIKIDCYPANWYKHGKGAGFMRNYQMAHNADACIVIWDGNSPGSKHMIQTAKKLNLYLHVVNINELTSSFKV